MEGGLVVTGKRRRRQRTPLQRLPGRDPLLTPVGPRPPCYRPIRNTGSLRTSLSVGPLVRRYPFRGLETLRLPSVGVVPTRQGRSLWFMVSGSWVTLALLKTRIKDRPHKSRTKEF